MIGSPTFAEKLRAGRFVVTAELTPPKGTDLADLFAKADAIKPFVDAVNLTDSPRARMTVEPKSVGHLLIDRGLEPIIQVTARDRNRIGIQSDLLGGSVLGLNNYVFMAGDAPTHGDHPDARAVYDWSAAEMLLAARELNRGRDSAGGELQGGVQLFVGATANPCADNFELEVENVKRKIDAGAQFLQTQALYDVAALEKFLEAIREHRVALLVGVIPLKSVKMATWLNANVPGIKIPVTVLEEVASARSADEEIDFGIALARRIMRDVRHLCAGVHIMAMGWEHHLPAMVSEIRQP